jgi:hypothetical protein
MAGRACGRRAGRSQQREDGRVDHDPQGDAGEDLGWGVADLDPGPGTRATRGQTTSRASPKTSSSTVAAPAAMAACTEIFHQRVMTQPQATPTAIDACRATSSAGASNAASTVSPVRIEAMATAANRDPAPDDGHGWRWAAVPGDDQGEDGQDGRRGEELADQSGHPQAARDAPGQLLVAGPDAHGGRISTEVAVGRFHLRPRLTGFLGRDSADILLARALTLS